MKYDVAIVGAGIAGLYSAYLLKKRDPKIKLLILESGDRNEIGGRARTEIFQGTPVSIGAGVGRKQKDKLLIQLLRELDVQYHEFTAKTAYTNRLSGKTHVKDVFQKIKREYVAWIKTRTGEGDKKSGLTFREFAKNIISKSEYEKFIQSVGYTDYENEDIEDVIYNYGFDDNYSTWIGLSIPWSELIDKLVAAIGARYIRTNNHVTRLEFIHPNKSNHEFVIHTKNDHKYQTKRLILATTIESVINLLPNAKNEHSIYQQIHGQSFLRVYGQFDEPSRIIMKQRVPMTTIVPGPIHKIIPINPDDGIYMVVYTDNEAAELMKSIAKNKQTLARYIEKALDCPELSLRLTAIKEYYWKIGTHYYSPLDGPYQDRADFIRNAQRPYLGVLVVGEMISLHQGWVEGALETVAENLGTR